jgi:hydroxymethylpyrimidine pyrophosphatase-like HAD family hydrolase
MLGVRYEEIIGVGDGHNDVPLLEAVGLKVAMGNAPDEVKAIADYVAPKLSEDGVADVIQRYILRD